MKKILVNLLAIGAVSGAIVACSSGSSSSNNGTPSLSATKIQTPANANPVGGSALYVDESGNVWLPIAGKYTAFALPTAESAAVLAAFADASTTVSVSGDSIIVIPGNVKTAGSSIYALQPTVTATPTESTPTLAVESVVLVADVTSNFTAVESTIAYAGNNMIYTSTGASVDAVDSCSYNGVTATGNITAINTYVNNGVQYVGFGTSFGSVCAESAGTPSQFVLPSTFQNLSAQAPSRYQADYAVASLQVSSANGYLFGYWQMESGQLYQVVANSSIAAQNFWEINSSESQTSTTTNTTVKFGNVPTGTISTVYVDNYNNFYVGNTTGTVYKLATGYYNWASQSLGESAVNLTENVDSNGNIVGAIASVESSNGTTSVFSLQ